METLLFGVRAVELQSDQLSSHREIGMLRVCCKMSISTLEKRRPCLITVLPETEAGYLCYTAVAQGVKVDVAADQSREELTARQTTVATAHRPPGETPVATTRH